MSFTSEHYVKVAGVIRELPFTKIPGWQVKMVTKADVISMFAEMFAKDNPKFNPGTFWDECQPLEEEDDGS